MKAEADELKAGKAPKEAGFIDRDGNRYRRPSLAPGTLILVPFPRFLLSSLPFRPKALTYVPFLSFSAQRIRASGPPLPEICSRFFVQFSIRISLRKCPFGPISRTADFGRLVALPFHD